MVVFFHLTNQSSYYGYFLAEENVLRKVGSFGSLGVYIFFAISGFVIPYSLYQSKYKLSNIWTFLKKRWIRIEPAYLMSIVLILINTRFGDWVWGLEFQIEWDRLFLHVLYLPEFFGFQWYNIIYWTLALEFQFYLLMALVFPLFVSQNKVIRIVSLLVFALFFFLYDENRLITNHSSLFIIGIVGFMFYKQLLTKYEFFVLLLLDLYLIYMQSPQNGISIAVVSAVAIFIILFVDVDFKLGREIGKISYSLYLTHGLSGMTVLFSSMYLDSIKENEIVKSLLIFVALVASVIFAYGFWYCIERPTQKIAKNIPY